MPRPGLPDLLKALVITPGYVPALHFDIMQTFSRLTREGWLEYEVILPYYVDNTTIADSDIIIFYRSAEPCNLRWLTLAEKLGKAIIYVMDEDFFAIPSGTPTGDHYNHPDIRQTIIQMLLHSHLIKVSSPELAELAFRYRDEVALLHGSVDFSLFVDLPQRQTDPSQVVVGYAGTVTHQADVDTILPALRWVVGEYPDRVQLEFMGCPPPEELTDRPNVSHTPWINDYALFLKEFWRRRWDIGLAPLIDNTFNQSKTEVKFREYGACGIPAVYSALPCYLRSVQDRVTGLLVPGDPDHWYVALNTLIEDADLRRKMGEKARAQVKEHYSIEKATQGWMDILIRARSLASNS